MFYFFFESVTFFENVSKLKRCRNDLYGQHPSAIAAKGLSHIFVSWCSLLSQQNNPCSFKITRCCVKSATSHSAHAHWIKCSCAAQTGPALNKKELHGMKWVWSGAHGYLKTGENEEQFLKTAAGVAFKGSIIVRWCASCRSEIIHARQLYFYHWIWRVPITTTSSTWQEWQETAIMPLKPLGSSNFSASLSWLPLGKEKMGPATEPLIYTLFWIGEFQLLYMYVL